MSFFKTRFLVKAALTIVAAGFGLVLIGISIEATTERFGNVGWVHWIVGFLLAIAGLVVTWAAAVSWLDRRALLRYRIHPNDTLSNEQSVALSGTIHVDGEPLQAPFSKTPCACVSFQVTGQRRTSGDNQYKQQLCLLGFHLAVASLDCGTRSLRLLAIPDVDTDFRHTAMGGAWGEQAHSLLENAADSWRHASEPEARDALSVAESLSSVPTGVDYYVSPTQTGSNQMSVVEDVVPIDTVVTVLARYNASAQGLDGQRSGGMKVFAGGIDERLGVLDKEQRKGVLIGLPLLAMGLALITLAFWWPG